MILKFCFENEIHRCSDPPTDFRALPDFLAKMFRVQLPSQFSLSYISPEGETLFLDTEAEYQEFINKQPSKTIKVMITERRAQNSQVASYELIPMSEGERIDNFVLEKGMERSIEKQGMIDDEKEIDEEKKALIQPDVQKGDEIGDVFERVAENISQKCMPQVQNNSNIQMEDVRKMVKDALQEEMPSIIFQVKEALIREGFYNRPEGVNQPQPNSQRRGQFSYQPYYSYPYFIQPHNGFNNQANQVNHVPNQVPQAVYGHYPMGNQSFSEGRMNTEVSQEGGQEKPHILDRVVNVLSGPLNKATEMVDNFVQKIEGDPYVYCPEGKYNKSTVDKVAQMKELFPEENRKDLLDFVQRFPKETPLDQIAEVYYTRKSM